MFFRAGEAQIQSIVSVSQHANMIGSRVTPERKACLPLSAPVASPRDLGPVVQLRVGSVPDGEIRLQHAGIQPGRRTRLRG